MTIKLEQRLVDENGVVLGEFDPVTGELKKPKPHPKPEPPPIPEATERQMLDSLIVTYHEPLMTQFLAKIPVTRQQALQLVLIELRKLYPSGHIIELWAKIPEAFAVFLPKPPQPVPDFDTLYEQIVDMGFQAQFDAIMTKFGATEPNFILSMISSRMMATGRDLKTTIDELLA